MHRNKWQDDVHRDKYIGLGGHVEPDEDVITAIRREVEEESGLIVEEMTLRGSVTWTGFGPECSSYLAFVFLVTKFSGSQHEGNEEGTLEWVPLAGLADVPMWDSDHQWLPMVFDGDPRQFHGVMPYADGEMQSWSYQRI
jgi:8-oxo-dGTP diphosphatase